MFGHEGERGRSGVETHLQSRRNCDTAAIAHLAHSTPPEFLFTATDFNSYVTVSIAADAPRRVHGRMAAPAAPGLGVTPRAEILGEPVLVFD